MENKEHYSSPEIEVMRLRPEGMLCLSTEALSVAFTNPFSDVETDL